MITHITEATAPVFGELQMYPLTLSFSVAAPLAVELNFQDESGEVPWLVDRATLTRGLKEPAGLGDVQFWPVDSDMIETAVCLSSDEGEIVLTVRTEEIRTFLEAAEKLLPVGAEEETVQAALDAWLNELMEA